MTTKRGKSCCQHIVALFENLYIRSLSTHKITLSAESQKGVTADQHCSIENQKNTIAIDIVQQSVVDPGGATGAVPLKLDRL